MNMQSFKYEIGKTYRVTCYSFLYKVKVTDVNNTHMTGDYWVWRKETKRWILPTKQGSFSFIETTKVELIK